MPRGRPRKVYDPELVADVRRRYAAGATQEEIAAALKLGEKVIWRVMRNHGLAARRAGPRDQRGAKNNAWRGGRSVTSKGYVLVLSPDHPRATAEGYVFEHIVVAERKLGRRLRWHGPGHPDSEIVHHLDGDRQNNDPANIAVTSFVEHLNRHRDAKGRNGGPLREVTADV